MNRALLISILLSGLSAVLTSCGKAELPAPNVGLLSTDVHVSVAQHTLSLPFIALEDYAYGKQSFSLDRRGDSERAKSALEKFLHESVDPKRPLVLDDLAVGIQTYGWTGEDMRHRQMCPMLTREWAQSVCDNPWAAVRQALPGQFRLVDLSRLQVGDPRGPANCRGNGQPHQPLPQKRGGAVMICTAMVFGGRDDQYHHAVVRIDGDLGALWMVWRYGQNGETAEAMAEREGKAIITFVQSSLGRSEDFRKLHSVMCQLRRPGSVDGPKGADCGPAARFRPAPEILTPAEHGPAHAGVLGGDGHHADVLIVLSNALIKPADLTQQITDNGVGPAGQILQAGQRLAAHHGSLQGQHDAQLREQTAEAVDRGGALLDKTLAGAVHQQLALLVDRFNRHNAHGGSGDGFADGGGIGRVVLAALAREARG